jgi:hypothetical protein
MSYIQPKQPKEKKMAQPKVYEGTWEELSTHAEEFRNVPKLTLIVPADTENGMETDGKTEPARTLAERLKGRVGLFDFGDANLSEDTGRKFTELLVEKHGKEPS